MATTPRAPTVPGDGAGEKPRGLTILLGIEGSPRSLTARDLVASARWPAGSTVHLVTAYYVPADWTGGVGATMDWIGDAEDQYRDELSEELREAADPLVDRGLSVEYHVVRGRPATAILQTAERIGADLIVVGSRGNSPLRAFLLGSVAAEVATEAPCAVLVARRPAIGRVLVATDGSSSAGAIPAQLDSWSFARDVPTDIVSVLVPAPSLFSLYTGLYTVGDQRLAQLHEDLQRHQRAGLDAMTAAFSGLGTTVTTHAPAGDAAHEILATADACNADLIVVSSRGLRGLERLLLGSVARNVLTHADCSVLVMRPTPVTSPTTPLQSQHEGISR
ncbi:MAG: universal stress protein [Chloroflexi bacterium]|nr:universal stress protein [Chloroflexota bacterium]